MSKGLGACSKVAPARQTPEEDCSIMASSGSLQTGVQMDCQRLMSISSSSADTQQGERIIVHNSKSGFLQLAKMLAVVAIPVVALVIVCSLQLSSAIQEYNAADAAIASFNEFLRLDKLVTGVQLERGTSAAWVSSRGTNRDVRIRLTSLWVHNDDALQSLTRWPPGGLHVFNKTFHTAKDLSFHINRLRGSVISSEVKFKEEIKEYTAITNALMRWSLSVIVLSNMATIVSNSALLLASDVIGIQRALCLRKYS